MFLINKRIQSLLQMLMELKHFGLIFTQVTLKVYIIYHSKAMLPSHRELMPAGEWRF